jgi:hypothetical protein
MGAYLFLASQRIMHAGFTATVGFKQARPSWLQPYLWDFFHGASARGQYLHQLHHYPTLFTERRLSPATQGPLGKVLVGEFPSSDERAPFSNYSWADAGLSERDPARYLERRLAFMAEQGYLGAFLWASEPEWIKARRVQNGGLFEPDPRVRWTHRQREQVQRFTRTLGDAPSVARV